MISSLFEVYDPYSFVLNLSLNWFLILFLTFLLFSDYWLLGGTYFFYNFGIFNFLLSEFSVFFNFSVFKSLISVFVFLFVYFLLINLFGLLPYVFSCSSHFVFCLSFSLPFWFGIIFLGWVNITNQIFSHLIPMGTPIILISFIVIIETVSQIIRPWSLAIRLIANMISGHLLMSLLGGCGSIFFFVQLGFFGFEFFVCFIQSYVFCALLVLYYGEV